MEIDNNEVIEVYLSSIWEYHAAGVERVLKALRDKNPSGRYSFEPELSWFKASCEARDVRSVQAIFKEVHDDMERVMGGQRVPTDNEWLKLPIADKLERAAATKKTIDHLCPVAFDRFEFRKVWVRIKHETPDSISVHKLLDEDARKSIMKETDTHVAIDTANARLIYIGGPTKQSVAKASKMLDNLFDKFVRGLLFSFPILFSGIQLT